MGAIKLQKTRLWQPITFCGVVCLLGLSMGSCAQDEPSFHGTISSSNGKDFYIGYMKNAGGESVSFRMTIGTTHEAAEFIVESRSTVIHQGTTSNSTPVSVQIQNEYQVTNSEFSNREKGLHVYATNNATIFIIAENYIFRTNYGVFLAYPCLKFETENGYEYIVASAEVTASAESQVLLVGCENDTEIKVIPSQLVSLPRDFQATNPPNILVSVGDSTNGTLHQMQTLLISGNHDLTGTKIVSNKPLTVIAGHECATIPSNSGGCEPFAVQIPPTFTWGVNFLLSPFSSAVSGTVYQILTLEETSVDITCRNSSLSYTTSADITATGFKFVRNTYCSLHSTRPILVVQFATDGIFDGIGESAITLVSPTDQYVSELSFITLPEDTFPANYIIVTVSAEHFNESRILLDGEPIDCQWSEIYNVSNVVSGYGCRRNVSSGTNTPKQHVLSHSDKDGLISAVVYGFNSYTTYAYLGSLHISAGNGMSCQPIPEDSTMLSMLIIDNSVKFVSPTFHTNVFTPDHQQIFREVTAEAINKFCSQSTCTLIQSSGAITRVAALTIGPTNVTIPPTLISENERKELIITAFVSIGSCVLLKDDLELAILQAEELYTEAGFLPLGEPTTPALPMNITPLIAGVVVGVAGLAVLGIVITIAAVVYKKSQSCKEENAAVAYKKSQSCKEENAAVAYKKSQSCQEENVINNGLRKEKSIRNVTEIPTNVRQDKYEDINLICNINPLTDIIKAYKSNKNMVDKTVAIATTTDE